MNKKIIFVHGYTASSEMDWYPAIRPLLDKAGWDYSIPDLPGHRSPKSNDWIKIIHEEVLKTKKPIVFIGHSLGTRAILLYLDKYKTPIDTVILISPLSNNTKNTKRRNGEAYPDFFTHKINTDSLKKLIHKIIIIHSTNDSSLAYFDHAVSLKNELNATLITFNDRDHFSEPENAPILFTIFKKELEENRV